jgi:cytochrome c553
VSPCIPGGRGTMHPQRRHCSRVLRFVALLFAQATLAHAEAPSEPPRPDGAALGRPCLACHGPANTGAIPEIRGVAAERLVARLRAYRDTLKLSVMHRIARGYTDGDYARLAAYLHDLRSERR